MQLCFKVFFLLATLTLAGCSHQEPTDELLGDLRSSSDADRVRAVRLLQNRTDDAPKVVPALIKSLNDHDSDVRRSAAIGLGYYGEEAEAALPALEKKEQDPDARVRDAARTAISRIRR
jgi:HEAT repeat protein